jgi:hypothetical protein
LPGCTVDDRASPQFTALRKRWRREYPHIDEDLADAFRSIAENILSKKAFRVQAGSNIIVYKYRQSSRDIRRGDRYGSRIIALYDVPTAILYPILVYPKPVLDNADTPTILAAIREVRTILGYCVRPGCDGRMGFIEPHETKEESGVSHIKTQCVKRGAIYCRPETA